jgi:hypothetical protein
MGWENDEWRAAQDDTPVRRFAGGIEIVGDKSDALGERPVAERNTDDEEGDSDGS